MFTSIDPVDIGKVLAGMLFSIFFIAKGLLLRQDKKNGKSNSRLYDPDNRVQCQFASPKEDAFRQELRAEMLAQRRDFLEVLKRLEKLAVWNEDKIEPGVGGPNSPWRCRWKEAEVALLEDKLVRILAELKELNDRRK